MKITPLEALEITYFLHRNGLWTPALAAKLASCITDYGLDRPAPSDGKRVFSRRTYTCPFFNVEGHPGCLIEPTFKPYGCLGFNPTRAGVRQGEGCLSEQGLLTEREDLVAADESTANDALRQKFNLRWEKTTIPQAVLELSGQF